MIRGLFLLLLFAVGLAAAVFFLGQVHHLRLAVPERLPAWTGSVAADAGLRQGQADLPPVGRWPATQLRWTARLPGRDGWVWDVALDGAGVSLEGQVALDFLAERAVLSGVTGSISLGALAGFPVLVQGIARVDALQGKIADLRGTPVITGSLDAQVPALQIDGEDFGAGPLTGVLGPDGKWQMDLALEGGVSAVNATMTGTLSAPVADLVATLADGAALPLTMRGMLAAAGTPEGPGWRLSVDVPFP